MNSLKNTENPCVSRRSFIPSVLLVLVSFHHHNTEKVAKVIANILEAPIKTPEDVSLDDLLSYDLVGFGSGIYGSKHHEDILNLANSMPLVRGKDAFIFSTCSLSWEKEKNHKELREILQSKGFHVIDEFCCPGYNTNSFIKYVGGLNKGRPNSDDLLNAENFALKIRTDLLDGKH